MQQLSNALDQRMPAGTGNRFSTLALIFIARSVFQDPKNAVAL